MSRLMDCHCSRPSGSCRVVVAAGVVVVDAGVVGVVGVVDVVVGVVNVAVDDAVVAHKTGKC